MTFSIGMFVDWCEMNGFDVAEVMGVLNAAEPPDDEEPITVSALPIYCD